MKNISPCIRRRLSPRALTSSLALTLALASAGSALAQATFIKADNTTDLGTDGSWTAPGVPGPLDIAKWDGAYNVAGSLSALLPGAPLSWQGVLIGNLAGTSAGLVSIGGTGAATNTSLLTIGSSGIDMSLANQDLVINTATNVVGGSQTWNVPAGRNLRLGTSGTGSANANLDGAGTVTISGGGVVDMNQGTGSGSGLAGFSGKFVVNPGATLRGLRNNTEAWGTSTAADTMLLKGGTLAVGGITGAQGNWSWNTPMSLDTGTSSVIDNQNPVTTTKNRSLTLNGVISGSGNVEFRNPTAAADTNFQFVVNSTTNTYSGTTTFTAPGGGEFRSSLGLLAGAKTPWGTGDVILNPGVTNRNQAGGGSLSMSIPNNYRMNGGGAALTSDDMIQTYSGTFTLTGTNFISTRWSGKNAILTGVIQDGSSPGILFKGNPMAGSGSLILDNVNTYSGGTTISNGEVYVRSSQGLGTGFVNLPNSSGLLYFNPNTLGITSTISAIRTRRDVLLGNNVLLDVTSGNVGLNTAAGFWIKPSGTGPDGRLTSSSGTLNLSSVDANGVLTTGNLTTSDHQIQTFITDFGATPVAVVKNGANSLQLTRTNTFTGGLTVNGGRLNANNGNAMGAGPVTVNDGAQVYLNAQGATYPNNITLNGIGVTEGTGNLGALRFGSSAQTYSGTVTAATASRIHAQDGNGTLSGPLAGSANVEKTGSSQLTISGASPSFSGTLTDAAGPLSFTGSMAGNLAVADAGTILGEGTVSGMVSLGSSTGAVIRVQGNTPGALTASGGLTTTGTNTIVVDSVPSVTGPFTVINYAGTFNGGLTNFTLAGVSAFRTSPVLADTGSAITLQIQNGLGLTWAGTNGNAWDLNVTTNWNVGASEVSFMQMDSVTFDDTAVNGTVNITGLLQPSSVTFNNATTEYTLSGFTGNGIVGPGSVAKNGTGVAILGGANDFTGPITVNAGVIRMGSSNAFGRASGIAIASGGQVDINGQVPGTMASGGYTYTIAGTGDGTGAIVNSGVDVLANAGVKNIVLADNASIGGNLGRLDIGYANVAGFGTITGNGKTLTKVGSSSMAFRGDASATPINVVADAGTIWAENTDNAFGGTNGTLTINLGARAGTYGTRSIPTPVTINNGGILHNQGGAAGTWTGTVTANDGAILEANTEVRIVGPLNAGGSVDKTGTSQVTILGTAAITGDIDVQDGVLQVGDMSTNGTIGNPGSVTITRNSDGNPGLRYRLGSVDASLSSPVNFIGEFSELRHHPAYPTNKLTLTGIVGNNQYAGILDIETGTMALSGSASATVNSVRIKGNPTAIDRGVLEIPAGTTLTSRYLNIGAGDRLAGVINQSGGTSTVVDGSYGVRIGHWNNNSPVFASEYNLTGGTLDATLLTNNVAGIEGEKVINVGWDGYGILNVGGGAGPAIAKVAGLRYDRNRSTSQYPSMMSVNANAVVDVGDQGIVGQGTTKTLLNGGKLVATANSLWTAPMQIADAVTGNIEVNTDVIVTNSGAVSGTGALSKTGAGALVLTGVSTYSGATTVSAGALALVTGGSCSNSAITLAGGTRSAVYMASAGGQWACGGLTYGTGSVDAEFNFGAIPPSTVAAPIQVNGNIAFNGTLNVRVSGNVTTVGTYPLIKYTGTLSGTPPTLPASLPAGLVANIVNNVANKSIDLHVTVGNVLTWADANGLWDIGTSLNWKDPSSTVVAYADGRAVQLDDTASGTSPIAITLDTTVNPAMVTAANATKDYSISGTGSIVGFAGLAKKGAAKLTLSGAHAYSSGTVVSEGTLQLGDGLANNGYVTGPIIDDATLVFANALDQTNAIAVSGTGAVVKASSGTLTFSTRQTYTGGTVINGGVLDLTAGGGATGTIRGTATVNTGGILRLSTGDAIGYALTDRVNPINLVGGTMDVNIQSDGGGNQTLGGATINMTGGSITGTNTGNIDFFQGGSTLNTFASPNPSIITGVPISPLRQGNTTFTVADGAAEYDLDITSVIRTSPSGDAAGAVLIKAGTGTMRLGADNTFTNGVQVDAGTLVLDGSLPLGATVTVNSGGSLAGNGFTYDNITVNSGGTLSPGTNGIGTLTTYQYLTLQPGSTTAVDVNAATSTSDLMQVSISANYGGTLVVTNHAGTPTLGQTFTLFIAGSPGVGNFDAITPPPGPGLAWKFDPSNGQLSVVTGPSTTPTTVTAVAVGSNYEVSWPADHIGWQLQVQTNAVSVGISNNWMPWTGSTTTNKVYVPILQSNPSVFLRLTYPPMP